MLCIFGAFMLQSGQFGVVTNVSLKGLRDWIPLSIVAAYECKDYRVSPHLLLHMIEKTTRYLLGHHPMNQRDGHVNGSCTQSKRTSPATKGNF